MQDSTGDNRAETTSEPTGDTLETIALAQRVKAACDLATVIAAATSRFYSDLRHMPDVAKHKSAGEFVHAMTQAYTTPFEVDRRVMVRRMEIDSRRIEMESRR